MGGWAAEMGKGCGLDPGGERRKRKSPVWLVENQPDWVTNAETYPVLSSLSEAGAVRKTRASGGRYFLCKPYDPNVLLAIIERALDE